MSTSVLLVAAVVVGLTTVLLLRISGAGRELFGRDSWMLGSRHDHDGLARDGRAFIEDHAFWSLDPDADREFWGEMPDGDEDDDGQPDIGVASSDQ
jgi:hypothetical protein